MTVNLKVTYAIYLKFVFQKNYVFINLMMSVIKDIRFVSDAYETELHWIFLRVLRNELHGINLTLSNNENMKRTERTRKT